MTYEEERNKFFKDFLDFYYFDYWKGVKGGSEYKTSLELYISPYCNTSCVYCYIKNFGKRLYPNAISSSESIIKNVELILNYFIKEGMYVSEIEIFSGEFFDLPYWEKILELVFKYVNRFPEGMKKPVVIVPSNSTFLFDTELRCGIECWIEEFKEVGSYLGISHSVDGKYLDKLTRPLKGKTGFEYNDEFYKRMFLFSRKHGTGFHPMVGAVGIECWKDNFDWYVENITKYITGTDIKSLDKIYLLEVRNPDWSNRQIKGLQDFLRYVILRSYEIYAFDKNMYVKHFLFGKGLNFLGSFFSTVGRGIGCSEQQGFCLRAGDLSVVPCHRTSYAGYEGGRFVVEEGEVTGIEAINPENFILYKTFDSDSGPVCSDCLINTICDKYCMGANFEVNKDFYIPVPSVCRMQFAKVEEIIRVFDEIKVLDIVLDKLSGGGRKQQLKVTQIEAVRDMIRGKRNVV